MTKSFCLLVRNNASKRVGRSIFKASVYDDGLRLRIVPQVELVSLNKMATGECQYAIVPFYGDDEYAAAVTVEYAGDLLDSIIHCPDGDIRMRDLNPQTGILMIGDYDIPNPITDYDEGDGNYKNYLYDDEN